MGLNTKEITILRFMFNDTRIGARHCGLREIQRGFPKHERGDVEDSLKILIKSGYVLNHPTSYGIQYSLNPRMIQEINEIISSVNDDSE